MPRVTIWKQSASSQIYTGIWVASLTYQCRLRELSDAMRLVADLLASTAGAHSPRAMVRAIATTLATRLAITRVELRSPAPGAIAVQSHGEWRGVDAGPLSAARVLADGLAVVAPAGLPAFCDDPAFRAA